MGKSQAEDKRTKKKDTAEKQNKKKYVLDCANMCDRKAAHDYLAKELELPDYYGHNLDALFDCLTEMVNTTIELKNVDKMDAMGDYSKAMIAVFEEADKANESLKVSRSEKN